MRILSVNIGPVKEQLIGEEPVRTGIVKRPVSGPVMIRELGLDGDRIGNPEHHGGPGQAVYAYAAEHYDAWSDELGRSDLAFGLFGENLTVRGWLEQDVCIGDTYRVGKAVLMASGFRYPCGNLAWRIGAAGFAKPFIESRRFGIYLRVIEPGEVRAGDTVEPIDKHPAGLGLLDMADLYINRKDDADAMRRALQIDGLADRARARFEQRVADASGQTK